MAIFILIGKTIKLLGVTTTSIAYKLSFIIPAIISILFYKDVLTIYKMIGIVTAVFSVYFIAYVPGNKDNTQEQYANKKIWIYPVIIFIGAGIIDASFNYIQRNFTPPNFDHIVSIVTFSGAFISGMILFGRDKKMYTWKNLLGGIILGIPNYGSLYFLLQALKHSGYTPSTLFPLNNLGIVCLSAGAGIFLFKEDFSARKIIGFILAVACILIIGFLN